MSNNTKTKTEERRFTVIKPEKGIELVKEINSILYNSDNKALLQHSHIIQKELQQQFQEIQSIFENRLKKTNLT